MQYLNKSKNMPRNPCKQKVRTFKLKTGSVSIREKCLTRVEKVLSQLLRAGEELHTWAGLGAPEFLSHRLQSVFPCAPCQGHLVMSMTVSSEEEK